GVSSLFSCFLPISDHPGPATRWLLPDPNCRTYRVQAAAQMPANTAAPDQSSARLPVIHRPAETDWHCCCAHRAATIRRLPAPGLCAYPADSGLNSLAAHSCPARPVFHIIADGCLRPAAGGKSVYWPWYFYAAAEKWSAEWL